MNARVLRRRLVPYAFLAPFFVMFAVFWLGPILYSGYLSLTSWDGFTPPRFIGISNYLRLLDDQVFMSALINTVVAAVVYVAILVTCAALLGIALGWLDLRGRAFFRTALFLPVTTALVVAAVVFSFLYGRDFGVINQFLGAVGLPTHDWLGDQSTSLWAIVGLRLWRNVGYYAIFIVAGLQAIPTTLYEAARVDGASTRQVIRHVTLPLLRPILLYVSVVSSIWALQLFDEPWVMTGGGPGTSTTTLVIDLYQNTFAYFKLGYGAAVSYVVTFIILVFALVQARLLRSTLD